MCPCEQSMLKSHLGGFPSTKHFVPLITTNTDCHSPSTDERTTPIGPNQLLQIVFGCPQIPGGKQKHSQGQINLKIAHIIFNYWEVKMHINIGFQ